MSRALENVVMSFETLQFLPPLLSFSFDNSLGRTVSCYGNWQCLFIALLRGLIELDCDADLSLK